jgi:hypothetical protein
MSEQRNLSQPACLTLVVPRLPSIDSASQLRSGDGDFHTIAGFALSQLGVAAEPVYLDVSVAPGRRKTLSVETTRHAFAYVFAGGGKFCNASGPLAVPTEGVGWLDTAPPSEADNRSLILFDRGDEVDPHTPDDAIICSVDAAIQLT